MPLLICYLQKSHAVMLFGVLLAAVLFYEKMRREESAVAAFLDKLFGKIVRPQEKDKLTGATYIILAAFLVVLLFDKTIAVTSLSIMIIADSFAAIVGKFFGKTIVYNKTIEGSAAFLFSAVLIIMVLFFTSYDTQHFLIAGLVASLVGTIAELISSKVNINDNILVTLSVAFSMQLMFAIL